MKGVEARACGVARYFPFVYPFYQENTSNFGMTDRRGTPLRSFACYAQMIRVLAHKHFLGDLRQKPPEVSRARVFGDDRESVLILYTKNKVTLDPAPSGLHIKRIEGMDGRSLTPASSGAIPIPDGLSYVWLDRPLESGQLDGTATARACPTPTGVEPVQSAPRRSSFACDSMRPGSSPRPAATACEANRPVR